MKRHLTLTADGSTTLQVEGWNEHYHSTHGAIQEAYWVFIRHGLQLFPQKEVAILEIGLGTGLNTFITFLERDTLCQKIHYTGVEAYPVSPSEAMQMNYVAQLKASHKEDIFKKIHTCEWDTQVKLSEDFYFCKQQKFFQEIEDNNAYDLIYFDAFGARVQPELWQEAIFLKMYNALKKGGVLVTYAAKGSVRRAMLSVGFSVEKLPGPPGKREMLRATKV